MRTKKSGLILDVSLILSMILLSILSNNLYSGSAAVTANSTRSLKEVILAEVSEREKVSIKDLEVVNTVTLKPENIYRAKIIDKKSGEIYGISLDSNHKVMDECDVDNLIESKGRSKFVGKLSKRLVQKMEDMKKSGESHIKVGMWIKSDEKLPSLPREMLTYQEQDARLKDIREFYANQKSTNSVLNKLKSMGHQVLYSSQYAPLIFVRMPIDDVTKVEADTNISRIYATEVMEPQLNTSALAVNADAAWHSDPNITGCCTDEWCSGSVPRVAVIDSSNVKAHPYLPGSILYWDANDLDPTKRPFYYDNGCYSC